MKIPALFAGCFLLAGCGSVHDNFVATVKSEFDKRPYLIPQVPVELLQESQIAHLPAPVRAYIVQSGSLGKPIPVNMRIVFDAQMWRKRGDKPLTATSVQYNFLDEPTRIFFMKASQYLVPFRVLHAYVEQKATMVVRVGGLFNVVDLKGTELTLGETVTILNDLCVFAPGALADPRLRWEGIDQRSSRVFLTNGVYKVSATLHFNDRGELVNFISQDRSALEPDGTMRRLPWSTPLSDYKEFQGRRLASKGSAIQHYPEGDFIYGKFTVKSVAYNVSE